MNRKTLANAIRALSMDAVQRANSGHPGMPMGMADIAEVLWNDFLRHSPKNPNWANRDRFVLSNGHGSMLHYSLLHLSGYDLSIDDLKQFRQLHSKTPGHPEYSDTPGIETTTGPLGQGLANAVGMAIAERHLAATFNRDDHDIVNHFTYVFAGDGCLMEGISHEVCSLAGHLGLGKLIVFYDDNGISIDGRVEHWFGDHTPNRFRAYDWQVIENIDGHDPQAIKEAIEQAQTETNKPTLICCKTVIGFGSPNRADTAKAHGAPLGDEEIQATRDNLGWTHAPFEIPNDIYAQWDAKEKGEQWENQWEKTFTAYKKAHPELAAEFSRRLSGELPANWQTTSNKVVSTFQTEAGDVATRKASLQALEAFAPHLPELVGGSADLTESNLTRWSNCQTLDRNDYSGSYLYYGVREFGMTAIMNGLALHGGVIPFGGTFLTFLDYARNAARMAALMKQRVILVYTHDSIGLGEDGPTHQPIEHINILRHTPNMATWRPCDAVETAVAWKMALERSNGPSSLLLSRQGLAKQPRTEQQIEQIARGGYILMDSETLPPQLILIATGSEVALAVDAAKQLQERGIGTRVVSMPSTDHFAKQPQDYQDAVLPPSVTTRIAIEAGSSYFWYQYVGSQGKVIGLDQFGVSAPGKVAFETFGFTAANIVETAQGLV